MTTKEIERISKALGDPNRIRIMQEVKKKACAQCSDIVDMLDLAQPSVSHHIKQLIDSGLLISQKEGRNISYNIDKETLEGYIKFLSELKE